MQFYSKNGIPFYVNLPEVVIRQCLGDPKVSPMIARYPIECEENEPIK